MLSSAMPTKPKTFRRAGQPTRQENRRAFDKQRDEQPWRKWYKTAAWQKARKRFLEEHPLCDECEAERRVRVATVVDHHIPHRGNYELFWDQTNWRPKCKPHHDRKTASGR